MPKYNFTPKMKILSSIHPKVVTKQLVATDFDSVGENSVEVKDYQQLFGNQQL